jgi:alkylation response protein AidB-like acyl-CoA dehydrogenase
MVTNMDTGPRAGADSFRKGLVAWLAETPRPAGLRDYGPTPASSDITAGRAWHRQLAAAGYVCLHWPPQYGGQQAPIIYQAILAEECARAGVPRQLNMVGPDFVGPVLFRFGRPDQMAQLEPIRTGEHIWCQLFSEPEAGSDLASVRTTARRDGKGWLVHGHKIWSSAAQVADYGILLARTGPGRSGLSAFAVPMKSAGITVTPIAQMDGESKFNEVRLESVRLEEGALLGEEGQGWAVATTTLGRERLSLGAGAVKMFTWLDQLVEEARRRDRLSEPLRHELVKAWTSVWLLRATWLRALATGDEDGASPAFSILKMLSSTTQRDIGELGSQVLEADLEAREMHDEFAHRLLIGPAQTILGGTTEIQRMILAERLLGLPREPKCG